MWLFDIVADAFHALADVFVAIYRILSGIPLIGDPLGDSFLRLSGQCFTIAHNLRLIGDRFQEHEWRLADILSWDWIQDMVRAVFFGGKWPWDWFYDEFWRFIDIWFPWLRDPAYSVWEWVRDRVQELIPVDFVRPWEIWDLIVDKVRALISEISIPLIPTFDEILEWFKDRLPFLRDLDLDPIGWLSEKMDDVMGRFLGVASWPLLYAVAGFLERMWEEEE